MMLLLQLIVTKFSFACDLQSYNQPQCAYGTSQDPAASSSSMLERIQLEHPRDETSFQMQ
jgi:hypothetical protein